MKKILAILLALTMVLALAVPTFAADSATSVLTERVVAWEMPASALPKASESWGCNLAFSRDYPEFFEAIQIEGSTICVETDKDWGAMGYWTQLKIATDASGDPSLTNAAVACGNTVGTGTLITADGDALYEAFIANGGSADSWKFQMGRADGCQDFNVTAIYVTIPNPNVTIEKLLCYSGNAQDSSNIPVIAVDGWTDTNATVDPVKLVDALAKPGATLYIETDSTRIDYVTLAFQEHGDSYGQIDNISVIKDTLSGNIILSANANEILKAFTDAGHTTDYGVRLIINGNPFNATKIYVSVPTAAEAPTYTITVANGTADKATAAEGETVTITANEPEEGREFSKWISGDVTVEDATASTTTFVMPAEDVKVTAKFANADGEEDPEEPEEPEEPTDPEEPGDDAVVDGEVVVSGKKYTEAVKYDTNYAAEVDAWSWNTPISYDTTPLIGDVVAALQAENAYIKIVASNTSAKVMLQSEAGNAGLNAPTFTVTEGDNTVAYYLGTDLIDAYIAGTGAAIEDGFWNLVIQPSSSVVISDLEIVTLTEKIVEEEEVPEEVKGSSGFLTTGDETHMIIINGAVITTAHEFVDGICVYCRHVDTTADDEVIVEIVDPVEPSTEEEEDETVPAEPSEEPEEDTNPETGLALALVPMMIAAAVAVITKK